MLSPFSDLQPQDDGFIAIMMPEREPTVVSTLTEWDSQVHGLPSGASADMPSGAPKRAKRGSKRAFPLLEMNSYLSQLDAGLLPAWQQDSQRGLPKAQTTSEAAAEPACQ